MVAETITLAAHGSEAIGINDRLAHGAFAAPPLPAHRSGGVTRSGQAAHRHLAALDCLAVANGMRNLHGRKGAVIGKLGIAPARSPARQDRSGCRRGEDGRARQALQLREPADMIVVLVAVEQQCDMRQLEPEGSNVVRHQSACAGWTAVDHDCTGTAVDQDRRNAASADVISIAEDLEGWRGLGPIVPVLALLRPLRPRIGGGRPSRSGAHGGEQQHRGGGPSEHGLLHWRPESRR